MRLHLGLAAAIIACAGQAAAANPGAITYALIGFADSAGKVPALNGVPGTSDENIDVPIPLRLIPHGYAYAVEVGSQNINYTGSCTTAYEITAKGTVLAYAKTKPYKCAKGNVWAYFWITPLIPDDKGAATLVAIQTYGTTQVKTVTPLIIQ
jgi:hypothetical protein